MKKLDKRVEPQSALWKWRKANTLTLAEAAKRVGITRQAWQQYENGIHYPRRAMVKRLMDETGISLEDLLDLAS